MKEFNKDEYNKLCAEFLRMYQTDDGRYWEVTNNSVTNWYVEELRFDSDWECIMEVVEAIENLKTETSSFGFYIYPKSSFVVVIKNYTFEIGDGGISVEPLKFNDSEYINSKSKKEAVVHTIWKFLNWYNENK